MKAIVLCGGLPQLELINNLKARGIETILLDMNENVVARPAADKFYPVSALDIEAVKKVAIDENADLILTACADQIILVTSQVSEMLGLPTYIDYKTTVDVSNKSNMKRIFKENNIPTSDFVIMSSFQEELTESLKYPLIVKPVDAYSSKGITKIFNSDELNEAFETALKFSRSKNVIVEEFVEGIELTIDAYIEEGISNVLCISRLDKIQGGNGFVINRCSCPAQISKDVKCQIEDACRKIAIAFNLKNSPLLVQLIVADDRISIIEFCARTGGGDKFRLIKTVTGFDVVDAVIELTLGNKPHVDKSGFKNIFVVDEFIYGKPGVMDNLEGFNELTEKGIISEYYQLKNKGDEISEPKSSGDRVAYFTVIANSYEEMLKKHRIAVDTVKILDIDGNDLTRRDIMEINQKYI